MNPVSRTNLCGSNESATKWRRSRPLRFPYGSPTKPTTQMSSGLFVLAWSAKARPPPGGGVGFLPTGAAEIYLIRGAKEESMQCSAWGNNRTSMISMAYLDALKQSTYCSRQCASLLSLMPFPTLFCNQTIIYRVITGLIDTFHQIIDSHILRVFRG